MDNSQKYIIWGKYIIQENKPMPECRKSLLHEFSSQY